MALPASFYILDSCVGELEAIPSIHFLILWQKSNFDNASERWLPRFYYPVCQYSWKTWRSQGFLILMDEWGLFSKVIFCYPNFANNDGLFSKSGPILVEIEDRTPKNKKIFTFWTRFNKLCRLEQISVQIKLIYLRIHSGSFVWSETKQEPD